MGKLAQTLLASLAINKAGITTKGPSLKRVFCGFGWCAKKNLQPEINPTNAESSSVHWPGHETRRLPPALKAGRARAPHRHCDLG